MADNPLADHLIAEADDAQAGNESRRPARSGHPGRRAATVGHRIAARRPRAERSTPPPGLLYEPELLTPAEEGSLLERVRAFEFSPVKMRGKVAQRRVAQFGWLYGYESGRIEPAPSIPVSLLPVRDRAARLGGVAPEDLVQAIVTEYTPGPGIGWHVDRWMFGVVIGVSLLGPCRMLFRPHATRRSAWTQPLEPRSGYVLAGEARWDWEHSIPSLGTTRYSITYRTLQPDAHP